MGAVIVDTSVLVDCKRDKTVTIASRLANELGERNLGVRRLIAAELLAGANTAEDWEQIETFLTTQHLVESSANGWLTAARIYFDCRRAGQTIRKLPDCYIAATAIYSESVLIHDDRDLEAIASISPTQQLRLELVKARS